jgi:D-psicose/D-tagatose/L-ribulose 3-epimerase
VTGLHWLLLKPAGLSISTRDDNTRKKTLDVMLALVDQCAELGGRYLVHGSPHQRRVDAGDTREAAIARAQECFARAAERAEKAGVVYCIEPLSSDQTPLINTLAEAAKIVKAIDRPSARTMLDCSSAGRMEKESLAALVDKYVPKGLIAHVQVNDRNRQGPGQGEQRFAPLLAALVRHKYAGDIAVEPFDYVPDGPAAAARAIGYIRGILEALQE